MPRYSLIIPIYNRPDECDELLDSLCKQRFRDFEVIVVEDGSTLPCAAVCARYEGQLDLHYWVKENTGPGQTRNFGVAQARGEFVIILDSDTIVPNTYLEAVEQSLKASPCDAFGGPDRAHESFTPLQKAINYSMTSPLTTGGIRGGKKKLDKFYPRSFNMGVRRTVYEALGGFSDMRFGEDIDFSTRLFQQGYAVRLFPEAWVYHKRRTDWRKFFKQVHNSGIARIHLKHRHPGTLKIVHLLPALFTLSVVAVLLSVGLLLSVGMWQAAGTIAAVILLLLALLFAHAYKVEKSLQVAGLAIVASWVQLVGYGTGFLRAWWQCDVRKGKEFAAFRENFYD